MIKPTVGRVVWYQPHFSDDTLRVFSNNQPLAAHVAYVHNDRLVNLMVIDPNGNPQPRTSVVLLQEGDARDVETSFCEWMPFQIGQAKRYEEEKKEK